MPCSCDGFEPTIDYDKNENDLRKMCCQAQSLAHKLGLILESNNINIPHEIKRRLEQHRDILQKHKEDELEKDIKTTQDHAYKAESRIKQIKGLGGTPNESTIEGLDAINKTLSELLQTRGIGRKLLGGV